MPELMKLRSTIYSSEFRHLVRQITGCDELTDRVDCAANVYSNSCHLLCHDDVIGTRCVSYIIYLTDPDDQWLDTDGGSLELYPLEHTATIHHEDLLPLQGVPSTSPSNTILPLFNSMAMFVVQPGRSYHSVQEVYCSDKPRLSIQGWYHAASPPQGSNFASLQQILTKDELDSLPFTPLPDDPYALLPSPLPATDTHTALTALLSQADIDRLMQWMDPSYLTLDSMKKIQKQFQRESSIQLHHFLNSEVSQLVVENLIEADELCQLGQSRPSMNYAIGQSGDWKIKGPSHKQRYMVYTKGSASSDSISATSTSRVGLKGGRGRINDANTLTGDILSDLYSSFFNTPEFLRYLFILTTLPLTHSKYEIRRFRCGLDYLVANMSSLQPTPLLDVTLCFINSKSKKDQRLWTSGDIGGYECYIEADPVDHESAATAEIYRVNDPEDDTELLSIQAGCNCLNIVLRDTEVMKFVKYVSYRAPSSRWDVSLEYKIDQKYFDEMGEGSEGGEGEEDSDSEDEDDADDDDGEEEEEEDSDSS
jgi:prolyl 3-hydroxylase /prolyl 3,4-dihydroxylase